jgi:hypothetical protein
MLAAACVDAPARTHFAAPILRRFFLSKLVDADGGHRHHDGDVNGEGGPEDNSGAEDDGGNNSDPEAPDDENPMTEPVTGARESSPPTVGSALSGPRGRPQGRDPPPLSPSGRDPPPLSPGGSALSGPSATVAMAEPETEPQTGP